MLMPADPRKWLPPGHLAWKVTELAAEMDLSRFGASYQSDGQGGRPSQGCSARRTWQSRRTWQRYSPW
jgi:hypothetical protein